MEQVIENIPALAKSKRITESMQSDLIVMLTQFIRLCHKKRFGPHFTVRLISAMKYVAQVRNGAKMLCIRFQKIYLTLSSTCNEITIRIFAGFCFGSNLYWHIFHVEKLP